MKRSQRMATLTLLWGAWALAMGSSACAESTMASYPSGERSGGFGEVLKADKQRNSLDQPFNYMENSPVSEPLVGSLRERPGSPSPGASLRQQITAFWQSIPEPNAIFLALAELLCVNYLFGRKLD